MGEDSNSLDIITMFCNHFNNLANNRNTNKNDELEEWVLNVMSFCEFITGMTEDYIPQII